jgi:hypothetical protein
MKDSINSRVDNLVSLVEREMGKNSIDEVRVTDENGLFIEFVRDELQKRNVYDTILSSDMNSEGYIKGYILVVKDKNCGGAYNASL